MKQMMKKALSLSMVGLLGLCLTVSSVSAGPFYATCKLEPTSAGYAMSAEGAARISRNVGQRFVVKVAAKVKEA